MPAPQPPAEREQALRSAPSFATGAAAAAAPFFVFVEREGYDGWRELRLYFDGRTLLCWIEDDGAPHDNDGSSDYADYYYEEGCLAYANATTALSTS